jgi:hypothetical protein
MRGCDLAGEVVSDEVTLPKVAEVVAVITGAAETKCCAGPIDDGFDTMTNGFPLLVMILWPPTIIGLLVIIAFPGDPPGVL